MAENENSITTYFKADISNFSASTQQLNRYISSVNAEFDNAVAGLGKWSDSQTGLSAKITQLNKTLDAEKRKLGDLETAYAEMAAAGKENTAEAQKLAIKLNQQSAKVKRAEADVGRYTDALNELQDAGVETKQELDDLNKKVEENGKAADEASGKFGGFVKGLAGIGAVAVGVVGSFVALAETTREYRNEMAKLDTAFETAGHSAETTEKTYKELYGILGDEGTATEAAQQLAKLSKDEAALAANTRILTGVMAEYGTSIPTEGLAEGMAATAAMGSVQGVLADALEWQGVNLEEYNAELATMTTEEERAAHIQKTLTELYGESADKFKERNADIIEARKAEAELADATAELGAAAEPLNTTLKLMGATLINGLLPYIKELASALQTLFKGDISAGLTQMGDTFSGFFDGLISGISRITEKINGLLPEILPKIAELLSGIIQSLISGLSRITENVSGLLPEILPKIVELLSGIIQSLIDAVPSVIDGALVLFGGIVQAIGPTLTALLNELPKIINSVLNALSAAIPSILSAAQQAFMSIVDALPSVLSALTSNLPKILQSVVDFLVNNAPKILKQATEFLMQIVKSIPTIVSALFSSLPKIITAIVETLVKNAPKIFSTALEMLGGLLKAIPEIGGQLLQNAPQIIKSIVKGLAGGVKDMRGIGKDLLKGLWEGMASLTDWIWKQIKSFFSDTLVGGIKKLLGIRSPSKVFAEMGEYSAEGYLGGFEDKMAKANKRLSRINYAGALGLNYGGAVPAAGGGTQNNYYNFNQTFEKMESTLLAQHRAKLEILAAVQGVK